MTARVTSAETPASPARLGDAAWTKAALELLAEQGIDGVRVELLAKRLGVTKGSFYWHFKDRDALHEAMLDLWRRRATVAIIDRLEARNEPPDARLAALIRLAFAPKADQGAQVELSIRLWSRRDPRPRAALAEVDALRLRYTAGLFREMGLSREAADARAVVAYAFQRVAASLIDRDDDATLERCIADLVVRPA